MDIEKHMAGVDRKQEIVLQLRVAGLEFSRDPVSDKWSRYNHQLQSMNSVPSFLLPEGPWGLAFSYSRAFTLHIIPLTVLRQVTPIMSGVTHRVHEPN